MADWHSGRQGPLSATQEIASLKMSLNWLQLPHWGLALLHWLPLPLQLTSGHSVLDALLNRASMWHHMPCL